MGRRVRVRSHRRKGRAVRAHVRHLYRGRKNREAAEERFERRYGRSGGRTGRGGRYIYFATVGKVKREQLAKRRRRRA